MSRFLLKQLIMAWKGSFVNLFSPSAFFFFFKFCYCISLFSHDIWLRTKVSGLFLKALFTLFTFLPDKAPRRVRIPGGDCPYDRVNGSVLIHFQKVHGFGENRRFIRIFYHDLYCSCVLEGSIAARLKASVCGFNFQGVGSLALIVYGL